MSRKSELRVRRRLNRTKAKTFQSIHSEDSRTFIPTSTSMSVLFSRLIADTDPMESTRSWNAWHWMTNLEQPITKASDHHRHAYLAPSSLAQMFCVKN